MWRHNSPVKFREIIDFANFIEAGKTIILKNVTRIFREHPWKTHSLRE